MQKLWTTQVHVHIAIATQVIQLPHSEQQACFINIEVWLVTLKDERFCTSKKGGVGGGGWVHPGVPCTWQLPSLGARPSKNRKGGSGTSAGVEVYTAEC